MRGTKCKRLRAIALHNAQRGRFIKQTKNNPRQALTNPFRHSYRWLKQTFSKGVKP